MVYDIRAKRDRKNNQTTAVYTQQREYVDETAAENALRPSRYKQPASFQGTTPRAQRQINSTMLRDLLR